MKIIEIIPNLASGGGERFVVDLCNELSKTNDVTLITLFTIDLNNSFYHSEISDRVKVISLNKKKGVDFKIFFTLYKTIRNLKPDIVHTHLRAITYTILLTSYKCFHTVHNDAFKEAGSKYELFIRKVLFKLNLFHPVTISEDSRRSFIECYKRDAPCIYNGRDIPKNLVVSQKVKDEFLIYRKDSNTRVIVQLAHIDGVKRQLVMAKCANRLVNNGYNFAVLFIGKSGSDEYLESVRREMPSCCFILGEKNNPLEYLKEAGAFGLCSLYEGLPISLLESLGVGAIPICTPVGGIKNIIKDGENGLLSQSIEEESYYQALKRFLEMSDSQVLTMSHKAIESYKAFTMKECAAKYLELFNK